MTARVGLGPSGAARRQWQRDGDDGDPGVEMVGFLLATASSWRVGQPIDGRTGLAAGVGRAVSSREGGDRDAIDSGAGVAKRPVRLVLK